MSFGKIITNDNMHNGTQILICVIGYLKKRVNKPLSELLLQITNAFEVSFHWNFKAITFGYIIRANATLLFTARPVVHCHTEKTTLKTSRPFSPSQPIHSSKYILNMKITLKLKTQIYNVNVFYQSLRFRNLCYSQKDNN